MTKDIDDKRNLIINMSQVIWAFKESESLTLTMADGHLIMLPVEFWDAFKYSSPNLMEFTIPKDWSY